MIPPFKRFSAGKQSAWRNFLLCLSGKKILFQSRLHKRSEFFLKFLKFVQVIRHIFIADAVFRIGKQFGIFHNGDFFLFSRDIEGYQSRPEAMASS